MGVAFSADEVFEMAEQIERRGAAFYREAAGKASSGEVKKMFLDMAEMEDDHLKTFQEMRQDLAGREKETTVFDPDNEAGLYLRALADSKGTEGMKSPAEKLTGSETTKEVLQIAIEAEKKSVLFYVGLKDLVSAQVGKDRIDAIIREEVGHIVVLSKKLKSSQ